MPPNAEPADGRRLKAMREAAGLTQEQIAEATGLHKARVSHLETGHKPLTLDVAYHIAECLVWRPSDLDPRLTKDRPKKLPKKNT